MHILIFKSTKRELNLLFHPNSNVCVYLNELTETQLIGYNCILEQGIFLIKELQKCIFDKNLIYPQRHMLILTKERNLLLKFNNILLTKIDFVTFLLSLVCKRVTPVMSDKY